MRTHRQDVTDNVRVPSLADLSLLLFMILGLETSDLWAVDKHSITKLHPESFPDFFYRHGFGSKSTDKPPVVFCLNKTYFCQGLVSITPAHKQTTIVTCFFMASYREIPTDSLYNWKVMHCVYRKPENSPFNSSHSSPSDNIGFFTFKRILFFSRWFWEEIYLIWFYLIWFDTELAPVLH